MTNQKLFLQQVPEIFHLVFLSYFGKLIDKRLYSVKRGCNLRFFFQSIRYSEDLDIDIKTVSKETLANKVNRLSDSIPFKKSLSQFGIQIENFSSPKQTETTQRWKYRLKFEGLSQEIPTKVEFSRRAKEPSIDYQQKDSLFEPITESITASYGLLPILLSHYSKEQALVQKCSALANRTEIQARDVFDIFHLLKQDVNITTKCIKELNLALEKLTTLSDQDFNDQVVVFLINEYQDYYRQAEIWQNIKDIVKQALKGPRKNKCHR